MRTKEDAERAVENIRKYPKVYSTVDIAIVDLNNDKILLGRKPNEEKYRLPGGFAEVSTQSYEEDAARELYEETGLIAKNIQYIGSMLVNDWRFQDQKDKIKTILYATTEWIGIPRAGDDLEKIQWFSCYSLEDPTLIVVPNHVKLLRMLFEWKNKLKTP